jgi:hypothetical protein
MQGYPTPSRFARAESEVIAERSPLRTGLGTQRRFGWRSSIGNNSHIVNIARCTVCPR